MYFCFIMAMSAIKNLTATGCSIFCISSCNVSTWPPVREGQKRKEKRFYWKLKNETYPKFPDSSSIKDTSSSLNSERPELWEDNEASVSLSILCKFPMLFYLSELLNPQHSERKANESLLEVMRMRSLLQYQNIGRKK
jgi:hypothetical protein